jgi:methionyl-tRNA formyltransferase
MEWKNAHGKSHTVELVTEKKALTGGDILFLISCHEIIEEQERRLYQKSFVIHASDLPAGRGWSPHVWQILEGCNEIIISLLEAEDEVDSGAIWFKKRISVEDHELADEINQKIFKTEIELMNFALDGFDEVKPVIQDHSYATYYPKRKPVDSKIDPNLTIAEQFDLLRISDPKRYPAFFEYRGYRYNLIIEKVDKITNKEGD